MKGFVAYEHIQHRLEEFLEDDKKEIEQLESDENGYAKLRKLFAKTLSIE